MAVSRAELSELSEKSLSPGVGPERESIRRDRLRKTIDYTYRNSQFYRAKLDRAGIDPGGVREISDLQHVPFTTKEELREAYPLGAQAASDRDIVRIHSSSGTTGKPIIIPYTQTDVETWAEMMARCLAMTGVTPMDRVQVTPGYGLWTAGIGFQAGVERLGAMAIPMGPGNTDKQLEMMVDLQTTVLIGTSSYGLLLAEEIASRNLRGRLRLRSAILGSERWGERMRSRIESLLGITTFDIYGLTEIYGPGIAIDCPYHRGLHYWDDHLIFEIVDPITGVPVAPGMQGELVITTITKEGMPLLRYRTRDLTRMITAPCECGSPYPMIDRIFGRTDDMIKIHGVNIYPGQIEYVLSQYTGLSSEYQIILTRDRGRDAMTIRVESPEGDENRDALEEQLSKAIKTVIGVTARCEVVCVGTLERSMKKTKRVLDQRDI